jgi:hypothetical protein
MAETAARDSSEARQSQDVYLYTLSEASKHRHDWASLKLPAGHVLQFMAAVTAAAAAAAAAATNHKQPASSAHSLPSVSLCKHGWGLFYPPLKHTQQQPHPPKYISKQARLSLVPKRLLVEPHVQQQHVQQQHAQQQPQPPASQALTCCRVSPCRASCCWRSCPQTSRWRCW